MASQKTIDITDSYKVKFVPTVESFAHVSQKLQKDVSEYKMAMIAYQAFVIINGLVFPAYLFLNDHYLWAMALFLVTIIIWGWIVPGLIKRVNTSYFKDLLGDVSNDVSILEIDTWGVKGTRTENTYAVPWKNITEIEETEDAIYFFFSYNGMFAAKSGFASADEIDGFLQFARRMVDENRR